MQIVGKIVSGELTLIQNSERNMLAIKEGRKNPRYFVAKSVDHAKEIVSYLDAQAVQLSERRAEFRKQRAEERRKAKADFLAKLEVGMLLHGSWGYDQTQCELYEVESIKGSTVVLKPVEVNREGRGWASEDRFPIKGAYKGDVRITRRISAYGVKYNDHCTLTPASWEKGYYCSWYA